MIPLSKPIVTKEMKDAVMRILEGTDFIMGKEVKSFESEFANLHNAKNAVALSSGTVALEFALLACGVGKGDEVLTVPNSFISTANCAIYVGAKPTFVDVDLETYNIDANLVEKNITPKTKALIPVHLFGHPADMDPIMEIAEKHSLYVIEDACQAHGSSYKGRKVGTIGHVGCFSFYPSKNMTVCGDGGMVTTNDNLMAEKIRMLRDYGRISKYVHKVLGYNSRLNEIHAAIGRVQLRHLTRWNEMRRKNAKIYDELLKGEGVVTPVEKKDCRHVYYMYVIRNKKRNQLKAWLENNSVGVGIHYPVPIHLQPLYIQLYGYKKGLYPISEKISREVLSLPMYPSLSRQDIQYVCEKIHAFAVGSQKN